MKGLVGLVRWPVADGFPTLLVTHQLQVERRTEKCDVVMSSCDVNSLTARTWWRIRNGTGIGQTYSTARATFTAGCGSRRPRLRLLGLLRREAEPRLAARANHRHRRVRRPRVQAVLPAVVRRLEAAPSRRRRDERRRGRRRAFHTHTHTHDYPGEPVPVR